MKYNDIKLPIQKLLDKEKLRLVAENDIFAPISIYSPIETDKCIIITAPYEFEAMQLVAEFTKEPGHKNISNCYAVVGNAVKIISKDIFLKLYETSNSNIDYYSEDYYEKIRNDKHILYDTYLSLLNQNTNQKYKKYIDFCLQIWSIRSAKGYILSHIDIEKTKTFKF